MKDLAGTLNGRQAHESGKEEEDFEIHWDGVCSGINGAVRHLESIMTSTLTCFCFLGRDVEIVMRYDGDTGGVWIGICIRFVYASQHY